MKDLEKDKIYSTKNLTDKQIDKLLKWLINNDKNWFDKIYSGFTNRMNLKYPKDCSQDPQWHFTNDDHDSNIIHLFSTKRTKEVIESEIKALKEELEELDKIKVGDVVLSPSNGIGVVIKVDDSTVPYEVKGIGWCKVVTKLDNDLTIREALGL